MSEEAFRLDNPTLVRREFASEERLETRNEINSRLIEGVNAEELLFHVLDRDRAISECARVLRPCGLFTTATLADENMSDLGNFLGSPRERSLTFSTVNGAEQLERRFAGVEARETEGVVVFATAEDMRQLVAANITRAHLAASVSATLDEPVPVRTHHTVFVAEKAA